ncbi:MAG: toll/interleukin-1 receptor domain-containing protein [Candidatus Zixiibacteriota bacterium]
MSIPQRDEKLIFKYLKENPGGLHFSQILDPPPKPVTQDGVTMMKSIKEVEGDRDPLFEYWVGLEQRGIIRQVDVNNRDHKVLTGRGKILAEKILSEQENFDSDEDNVDLESLTENNKEWDFFICHASEDKAEVVEPLALELASKNSKVWYDRWALKIGDSLSTKIDEGLANSQYGIVVLSPYFFTKQWPQRELGGLVQREVQGRKVILPVWHKVDHSFIVRYSPTLADKMAGTTTQGIPILAARLLEAIGKTPEPSGTPQIPQISTDSAKVEIGYQKVKISSDLHHYSLTATLTLLVPPDQGRLRLRLLWPKEVPIVNVTNIREGLPKQEHGVDYKELFVDFEHRVFPGETVDMLGTNTTHQIVYAYDDEVYDNLTENPRDINYILFFEDHTPVSGKKPFRDLNVF